MSKSQFDMVKGEITVCFTIDQLRKLYAESTHEGKEFLESICTEGKEFFKAPTLDDYKSIKTYLDACVALGVEPLNEEAILKAGVDKHVIALMKLETVSRALWGRKFMPVPQPKWDGHTYYWWPWFVFYTKEEVDKLVKEHNEGDDSVAALFGGVAYYGAIAGFGFLSSYYRPAYTSASIGFRLCQETEERARYFASQFATLWAEYLAFNFLVGERIF